MKSRDEVLTILRRLKPLLAEKYDVSALGLSGSVARGTDMTEQSDVDVLVRLGKPLGWDFVLLANEIEAALGVKTDVVEPGMIRERLWPSIEEDLIYV